MTWIDTEYALAGLIFLIVGSNLLEKSANPADIILAIAALAAGIYALLNTVQNIDPDGV